MNEEKISSQNARFEARKRGEGCPLCDLKPAGEIIANVSSGSVRLVNDADYRGYLILIYKRHVVELHQLSPEERVEWIEDIALLSEIVQTITGAVKINLALYGNLAPHLHCHIIPRTFDDPEWIGPPMFRSDGERRPLPPHEYTALSHAIKAVVV
ncbi:MAG: HIT family protein [Chthonomonadaceae bacterium]|nr:HIT family protein [Chthonomonadaceae bacterium]